MRFRNRFSSMAALLVGALLVGLFPAKESEDFRLALASLSLRAQLFGHLRDTHEALYVPNPFWRDHLVFTVNHYTWPHIPDCRVAISPDLRVFVLSIKGDGFLEPDSVGHFNRIAREEEFVVLENDLQSYVRFVLDTLYGPFRPGTYIEDESVAVELVDGVADWDRIGLSEEFPIWKEEDGVFVSRFFYWEAPSDEVRQVELRVRGDGTIAYSDLLFGRTEVEFPWSRVPRIGDDRSQAPSVQWLLPTRMAQRNVTTIRLLSRQEVLSRAWAKTVSPWNPEATGTFKRISPFPSATNAPRSRG